MPKMMGERSPLLSDIKSNFPGRGGKPNSTSLNYTSVKKISNQPEIPTALLPTGFFPGLTSKKVDTSCVESDRVVPTQKD